MLHMCFFGYLFEGTIFCCAWMYVIMARRIEREHNDRHQRFRPTLNSRQFLTLAATLNSNDRKYFHSVTSICDDFLILTINLHRFEQKRIILVYVNFNSSFVSTLKFIASNWDDFFHWNATRSEAGVQTTSRHNVQQERISFLVFTKESCIELFIHQKRHLVKPARYCTSGAKIRNVTREGVIIIVS